MSQQVRQRFQRVIQFSSNNKESEQLGRGMVYRELQLRLEGQLTVTAGNNTAAKTLRGDEWACIKRIDIIANNTDVIKSIKGSDLFWFNFFLYGKSPRLSSALADGTTANPAFDSVMTLPFWMPRSVRPFDTALDARILSDLKIEITWGSHTDINGDATGFTVAPTLKVNSLESFNVDGTFSQWRKYFIEQEINADNPQFQIQLPVGPMYRGFLFYFTDAGADDSAVLNNFKVKSGTTVFADIPALQLHDQYLQRHGISDAGTRRGNANDLEGVYMYDHVTDGMNTEAIDTLGFSEFLLEMDVTKGAGTTKVIVYPQQIIPVRANKQ